MDVRRQVEEEILSSEEAYVNQLSLVIKIFEEPIRNQFLVPAYVIRQIFGNISQILNVNNELLVELKEKTVTRAFKTISPFFKLYASYARSHEKALKTLMEWETKSQRFAKFRREQEEQTELRGLKLNALLITPVQRIPRYKLLLEELLKCVDTSDSEYADLKAVSAEVAQIADYINEHIRSYDNTQRILEIQRRLTGGDKRLNVIEPGRLFIKEGLLKKVSNSGQGISKRKLFLFSDVLMYAKVDSHDNYSVCSILPLHKCEVCCLDSRVLFYCESKRDRDSWLKTLTGAISVYRKDRKSLRKDSSGRRPMRGKLAARVQADRSHHTVARSGFSERMTLKEPDSDERVAKRTKPLKRVLQAALTCSPIGRRRPRSSLL